MVIDMSMWSDLHVPPADAAAFPRAHYYWRIGLDPDVRRAVFDDDWRKADYVIATPQLLSDTAKNHFPIVAAALENSVSVKHFDSGGWRIDVRRVDLSGKSVPPPPASSDSSAGCMSNGT